MFEKRLAYFQSGKIFELTNISQNIFICIYGNISWGYNRSDDRFRHTVRIS